MGTQEQTGRSLVPLLLFLFSLLFCLYGRPSKIDTKDGVRERETPSLLRPTSGMRRCRHPNRPRARLTGRRCPHPHLLLSPTQHRHGRLNLQAHDEHWYDSKFPRNIRRHDAPLSEAFSACFDNPNTDIGSFHSPVVLQNPTGFALSFILPPRPSPTPRPCFHYETSPQGSYHRPSACVEDPPEAGSAEGMDETVVPGDV